MPDDDHRTELRVGQLRPPISDDSASSSSSDSTSSSVTSGVSGASHERNTRLSLLWTSRLNRTGNDSDSSLGGGYDLEERRGEGSVMRRDNLSEQRRTGRDTPESVRNYRENPEQRRTIGSEIHDSRRALPDTSENRRRMVTDAAEIGQSLPVTASNVLDSRRMEGNSNSSDSSRMELEIAEIVSLGSDDFMDSRNGWEQLLPETPESRARETEFLENNSAGLADSTEFTNNNAEAQEPAMSDNRRAAQGGRWMYYRGKFHGRTTANLSGRDSARSTVRDSDVLNAPGPSGVLSGSQDSFISANSTDQSSQQYRSPSLLDPHFGVQLLSRHIENMQRICRYV